MGFPVRLCALIGRFADPRVAESVDALIPHLLSRDVKVIVSDETSFSDGGAGIVRLPVKEIGQHADLVIAIGGDGT
jgi:NAD+ kinase